MNIRKQSADEHTVIGYVDFCQCAMPRAVCGCSTQTCVCACQTLNGTIDTKQSVTQYDYTTLNSALSVQNNNSSQSKAIH